jgi:hypothetical protein
MSTAYRSDQVGAPPALSSSSNTSSSSSNREDINAGISSLNFDEVEVDVETACDLSEPVKLGGTAEGTDDDMQFSRNGVKRKVLESLPEDLKQRVPLETWDRIFNDTNCVLSEEIASLANANTQDDVNDIVSFVSVWLQREAQVPMPGPDGSDTASAADSRPLSRQSAPEGQPAVQPARVVQLNRAKVGPSKPKDRFVVVPRQCTGVISASNRVKFGNVEVRLYQMILSDNPAVSAAPPVGLGWKYSVMNLNVSVDEWEHERRPIRRVTHELVLPRRVRANIVFELGYTQQDIAEVNRSILRIKNQRKQTYHNLKLQGMEEFMEKMGRIVMKVLTLGFIGGSHDRKYKDFQKNQQPVRPA